MITKWFDRGGRPITAEEAFDLVDDWRYRQVCRDVITVPAGQVLISTLWLGVDLGFATHGQPPLIFETMVIGHTPHDNRQWRAATEEQAINNHQTAIALVRQAAEPTEATES